MPRLLAGLLVGVAEALLTLRRQPVPQQAIIPLHSAKPVELSSISLRVIVVVQAVEALALSVMTGMKIGLYILELQRKVV
jgi:hypothetical protein